MINHYNDYHCYFYALVNLNVNLNVSVNVNDLIKVIVSFITFMRLISFMDTNYC